MHSQHLKFVRGFLNFWPIYAIKGANWSSEKSKGERFGVSGTN